MNQTSTDKQKASASQNREIKWIESEHAWRIIDIDGSAFVANYSSLTTAKAALADMNKETATVRQKAPDKVFIPDNEGGGTWETWKDNRESWAMTAMRLQVHADKLAEALRGLVSEVKLGKLNVRKDFSLMNAHAYAGKCLHNYESEAAQ